jgi:16S rRNA (cytidine1402-2'-O)-methyltransferase
MTHEKPGTLYVVATPLGNLGDLSPRAVRTLSEVSVVACEDTRHTAVLLGAHGIKTRTISYHEHNVVKRGDEIVDRLRRGEDVALVCDAGTPAISDPGERLVRSARLASIPVIPVPGPSAALAALSASGLPSGRFLFVGFLPHRQGERRRALQDLAARAETLVFYESPLRVVEMLRDAEGAFGDREAFLCREATKVHEEYSLSTLGALRAALEARSSVKGEIVVVVRGAQAEAVPADAGEVDAVLKRLRATGLAPRAVAREAARILSWPSRELYRTLLDLDDD